MIDYDFLKLYDEVDFLFDDKTEEEIYQYEYLNLLKNNQTLTKRRIDLLLFAKVDMIYSILFLGLSTQDRYALDNLFSKRYNKIFYSKIIAFASLKPKEQSEYWPIWETFNKKGHERAKTFEEHYNSSIDYLPKERHNELATHIFFKKSMPIHIIKHFNKYYGGHQYRLGHYFRHLFLMVNYINDSNLTFIKKLENIRLLRAQLSTYEQRIFFLNSISSLGRIWELENLESSDQAIEINNQLITKYNFIKNIPSDRIAETQVWISKFYPDILLETSYNRVLREKRDNLEASFN